MTRDYSTSKFENETAERAYAVVLDGFAEDSIYDGESVAFDLVTVDESGPTAVILRYDSQGFVDVEMVERADMADTHGHHGRDRVTCHFDYLRREYATVDNDD